MKAVVVEKYDSIDHIDLKEMPIPEVSALVMCVSG